MTWFTTSDSTLAQQLLRHKERVDRYGRDLRDRHFARLNAGLAEAHETSAIYLDLLTHLKRINSCVTHVAYATLKDTKSAQTPAAGGGECIVRIEGVDEERLGALLRVVGIVGGRAHVDERIEGVVVVAVTSAQIEALRTQLLAAPPAQLRLAEELATAVRAYLRRNFELRCCDSVLEIGRRPLLMGVLNCTPDSFYPSSRTAGEQAVGRGVAMVEVGADLLDIGGESTRPGSVAVDAEAEI